MVAMVSAIEDHACTGDPRPGAPAGRDGATARRRPPGSGSPPCRTGPRRDDGGDHDDSGGAARTAPSGGFRAR
jgi:hypothetical protein